MLSAMIAKSDWFIDSLNEELTFSACKPEDLEWSPEEFHQNQRPPSSGT